MRDGAEPEGDSQRESRRNLALIVSLVSAGAAIVAIVFTTMKDKGIYAKPVDALAKESASFIGRPVRAEGFLVRGSLEKRENACEYRFVIRGDEAEIPVRYATCALPDGFQDKPDEDLGVTVEGKLLAAGSLEASSVLTKCPSRYKERAARGEKAPQTLGR